MTDSARQAERPARTSSSVQAHLVRPAKSPARPGGGDKGGAFRTRNWSLFFFFRVMRRIDMRETRELLESMLTPSDEGRRGLAALKLDLTFPAMPKGGLVAKDSAPPPAGADARHEPATAAAATTAGPAQPSSPETANGSEALEPDATRGKSSKAWEHPVRKFEDDYPAHAFLNWLQLLVDADGAAIRKAASALAGIGASDRSGEAATAPGAGGLNPPGFEAMVQDLATNIHKGNLDSVLPMARNLPELLDYISDNYATVLEQVRRAMVRPPAGSPHGPLARMVLYEVLRQAAPLFLKDKPLPVLRSEDSETQRLASPDTLDRTPITMAFTFAGLSGLKIDRDTLRSFPDAFKEGMAARAARLGDVGRSGPENWEGELGLPSIHGYFTGGSSLERGKPLPERFWKKLREEIRSFNDPTEDCGLTLRQWIGLLFRLLGLEIVHIELGQDPYRVTKDKVEPLPERVEHFGFRDGVSQPFVDLGLGSTLPGGGTADRRGSWTPIAPGEIFLDREDESGRKHMLPLNDTLRDGSTYLVFRKLEQDVEGFRAFLEQQRPNDPRARKKLAAQFFGRWPNGTSLVHSPHSQRSKAGAETEAGLNDFRYAADDPSGRKCPLGAHVRRANPRDIGGRNDVRHHRILRRGIAYGGPLWEEGQSNDGEKRGILFIAANARIDLQFEVVQADWLNRGEFLGQAGLGRCPIAGANDGSTAARFLEAGAVAPVTGLPAFVTMRGGDYFFAPGIPALREIARGGDFKVAEKDLPYRGHAINDVSTPSLFSDARFDAYWKQHLGAGKVVRVPLDEVHLPAGADPPEKVAFVGRYDQVKRVLSNEATADGEQVHFSVEPYCTAGRRISRGEDFLIGTDAAGSKCRARLLEVLERGWATLHAQWGQDHSPPDAAAAARDRLQATLRRTSGSRRIDLVDDLAVQAAYGVLDKVYGIRGPEWLTELAGAIPFARQHVGDLPADWIAAFKGERPSDPGLKTMQIWSTFLVADLIGNSSNQQPLQAVARQAGSEMINHIDQSLAQTFARLRASGFATPPANLIEAFLLNGVRLGAEIKSQPPEPQQSRLYKEYHGFGADWQTQYLKDAAIILLEILGSTLAVIPLTFGSVMAKLLELRIDLSMLLPRLEDDGAKHIVYEAERLNPNSAVRTRRCLRPVKDDAQLASIEAGDFVAALIGKANMDRHVFWQPQRFSLGTSYPMIDFFDQYVGPGERHPRDMENYLLFGVAGSKKICWGRHLVAMPVLEECIYACGRLQGLRRVAGPMGEPQKIGTVTIGLPARFTRILTRDTREL